MNLKKKLKKIQKICSIFVEHIFYFCDVNYLKFEIFIETC